MDQNQMGQPAGVPAPKRPTPAWVWVLVGMFLMVVIAGGLYGGFVLGQRAQYRRAGGSTTTWWNTAHAVDGQTSTIEVPVLAATSYRFYVVCDPPGAWSLRVQWKP